MYIARPINLSDSSFKFLVLIPTLNTIGFRWADILHPASDFEIPGVSNAFVPFDKNYPTVKDAISDEELKKVFYIEKLDSVNSFGRSLIGAVDRMKREETLNELTNISQEMGLYF